MRNIYFLTHVAYERMRMSRFQCACDIGTLQKEHWEWHEEDIPMFEPKCWALSGHLGFLGVENLWPSSHLRLLMDGCVSLMHLYLDPVDLTVGLMHQHFNDVRTGVLQRQSQVLS